MKSSIQNSFYATVLIIFSIGLFSFSPNHENTSPKLETIGGAYLTFAGKFGGDVTHSDLKQTTEIGVSGCARGSKIFQFQLKITKSGKQVSYKGSSPILTKEMLTTLRSLSSGDEFIFKKVKAHLPNGKSEVDVWGKNFTVV